MAAEVDIITKRPRTPNDQYSVLTEQQIRNIKQDSSTFFHSEKALVPPVKNGRYYKDRYATLTSGHLLTGQQQSYLWIGEKKCNDPSAEYNCCRGMASVKWGRQKIGQPTVSHFYGENVERYTLIDAYRRPATCYAGRVVMDCGRPADGYYTQHYPDRTTWFKSSVPLNCTNTMQSVYRKSESEYDDIRSMEKMVRRARTNLWPEYSEYTDKYLLQTRTCMELSRFEKNKQHAALGQRLQKLEMEEKAAKLQQQELQEMMDAKTAEASPELVCKTSACNRLPLLAA